MINPILSLIQGKQLIQDHYGNMVEIDEWSHDIARKLAEDEGVELSGEHIEVLDFLRDHVINQDQPGRQPRKRAADPARAGAALRQQRRWPLAVNSLFPGGPVRQGMKIAGLPEAPRAVAPPYGTAR